MGAGMNPRQMNMMMKKLGIDVQEIPDVQEIIIRTPTKDLVFEDASVSVMDAQGSKTYTITGTPTVKEHGVEVAISGDDVKMVMEQTGCDEAKARAALEETGDLAEAILKLSD